MNPGRFRSMTRRLIRRAGGGLNVTLRRSSSLNDQRTGDSASALVVAAAAIAGATTIVLELAAPALLRGELVAGATFELEGHATTYTTTAAASVSKAGELTLTFTPGLEAPSNEGDDATIVSSVVDAAYEAMQARLDEETVTPQLDGLTRVLHLAAVVGRRAPQQDDLLLAAAGDYGRNERVAHVTTLEPRPGQPVRWTVWLVTKTGASS